jgi:hypothetical protein
MVGPASFPVFFPVTREWGFPETGSLMTASSSKESRANLISGAHSRLAEAKGVVASIGRSTGQRS